MQKYMTIKRDGRNHFQKFAVRNCFLVIAVFLMINSVPSLLNGAAGSEKELPFQPGEKLTYRGRWGLIQAGQVTLEVLPMANVMGMRAWHFTMITKTNSFVDLLYKIREQQDSFVDAALTHSLLYTKHTESKHPREIVINFDWKTMEATRSNFGKKSAPVKIEAGTIDPLALFYFLRLQDLRENTVLEIPITDGDMTFQARATVARGGIIRIDGNDYDTLEVVPDMERFEKVVKKSDEPKLKIWFTKDEKKLPVKIQTSAGPVTFVFELVSFQNTVLLDSK